MYLLRARIAMLVLFAVKGWSQQNSVPVPSLPVPTPDLIRDEQMAKFAGTSVGPEREYLAAIIAAREGHDDEAAQLFTQALPGLKESEPDSAALALRLLADVYDREGKYDRSARLYEELEQSGLERRLPVTYRAGAHDDADLARILANSPRPTLDAQGTVRLKTSRKNPLGLITTRLAVNGISSEWILDTGANQSVVTRSFASRLHLRVLPGVAHTSAGITGTENTLHVALLPDLPLGATVAHNVVLLVLDDSSLTFSDGKGQAYRIDGIIGFPVLRALGRLTFHHDGTLEASTDGTATSEGTPLQLRLLNPVIEASSEGQLLPFTLDTGASGTTLSVRYYDRFQADKSGWKTAQTKSFGAGGTTASRSFLVRSLALGIGDHTVNLHNVPILPTVQHSDIDALFGNIGEDLFQSVENFTFDFKAMRFSLGESLPVKEARRSR